MSKKYKKLAQTIGVRYFGWTKVPVIGFVQPRVVAMSEELTEIIIPLTWRTRNHLKSMYFGVLATGADIACGLLAVEIIHKKYPDTSFVFKDVKGQFLKRAEADTHFVCRDGKKAREMVEEAQRTGERVNQLLTVEAICPSVSDEPVAKFELTLSVKKKS